MTFPDGQSHEKHKEYRNEAVSSVVQEMGSSRLRILSDLMESRKRAEAHEQEFLRTIHSENAAFSQIVSMFESHLKDIQTSSARGIQGCLTQMSSLQSDVVPKIRAEVVTELSPSISLLREEFQRVSSDMDLIRTRSSETQLEIQSQLLSLEQGIQTSSTELGTKLSTTASMIRAELFGFKENISSQYDLLCEGHSQLSSRISSLEENMSKIIESIVESRLKSLHSTLSAEFDAVVSSQNESINALLTSTISSLESRLMAEISTKQSSEEIFGLEQRLVEGINEEVRLQEKSFVDRLDTLRVDLDRRFENLSSKSHAIAESDFHAKFSTLVSQFSDLNSSLSKRLSDQDAVIRSMAASGHHYDWVIDKTKLVDMEGKYVISEPFSIGPYSNMQLRYFPTSGTVWLIHPVSQATSLPVYVDLGVDDTKKCMCKMKKSAELFGHWIWEAVVGVTEQTAPAITISVEISMRQWMSGDKTIRDTVPLPPTLPSSPSSSTFTFLPTNPFTGSTTPRRESWAKFGTEEGSTNPFRTL